MFIMIISALFVGEVSPSTTPCANDVAMEACTFSGYHEEFNHYCRFTCNCDVECNEMLVTVIPNRNTIYELKEVSWYPVADDSVPYL